MAGIQQIDADDSRMNSGHGRLPSKPNGIHKRGPVFYLLQRQHRLERAYSRAQRFFKNDLAPQFRLSNRNRRLPPLPGYSERLEISCND